MLELLFMFERLFVHFTLHLALSNDVYQVPQTLMHGETGSHGRSLFPLSVLHQLIGLNTQSSDERTIPTTLLSPQAAVVVARERYWH